MPHRQQQDFSPIVAVENNISRGSDLNHPLAKLWRKFFDRTANFGMFAELLHAFANCPDGAAGSFAAVRSKKIV